MTTTRAHAQAGFTLVEVMIAIALMAVLSVMAWRGLDSVSRANNALERRTEEVARLLRALDQLERDLSQRATTELPGREGGGAAPAIALLPASLQVRRQTELPFFMEIVRAAPAAPGYWQRVQWWRRGSVLYRAAGPVAASFPLPPPDTGDRVALLDDVTAFELRAWEPGAGWRPLPAVASARAGATGMELALGMRAGADRQVQTYRRVFPLE
ncbi:PulJ/GspJ family protein [Variovorax sp. W6]|uniref:PulJ/GspJ family protein n=1 Tax=Variovorax sp. W6 TaxID=3093895 RepID=UPI003D800B17